ncbi:hypothetical protein CAC42_3895 [Sphaceloma murrayae]|uniref:Polyprenal reductase n=1 Tax=Sphaceloma murrayae TaxID=2082308 RepID=A0A2K1QS69_9PEZI|nr:hypothetical protein CAC42_3895 [Sphaceloma murrayae]
MLTTTALKVRRDLKNRPGTNKAADATKFQEASANQRLGGFLLNHLRTNKVNYQTWKAQAEAKTSLISNSPSISQSLPPLRPDRHLMLSLGQGAPSIDAAAVIESSYVLAAAAILFIRAIPPLRNRFLAYGSRVSSGKDHVAGAASNVSVPHEKTSMDALLDWAASLQVPHSWFTSFYMVSLLSSMFWAYELLLHGSAFQLVVGNVPDTPRSMTIRQVVVTSAMMLVQGSRRLYECLQFSKPSTSKMFIGHWIMGVWFYLTMGVAVWIEGIPALTQEKFALKHFQFVPPTPRTFISFIVFVLASGAQRDCHGYLSSLKQYAVPEHPAFHALVCPHYFAECLIYLSMAVQAAPSGTLLNRTILSAFIFVAINLGVTADGTKKWYAKKFGSQSVEGKWRMIPYLF